VDCNLSSSFTVTVLLFCFRGNSDGTGVGYSYYLVMNVLKNSNL